MPNEADLELMDESELEEYLALLMEEEDLREISPITFFSPHVGQLKLYVDLTGKITVIEAGNRGGKSELGAAESAAHSLGARPWLPEDHPDYVVRDSLGYPIRVPNKGLIAGESFGTAIRKTIIPKLLSLIPPDLIKTKRKNQSGVIEYIELTNGSTISAMAYNQDPKEFEGTDWHWAWFDEPCPYSLFEATMRGLVDHAGRIWFTMTPLKEPWIYQELTSKVGLDPDIKHVRFSAMDNPHVPREELMKFFAKIKDPAIRKARMYGTPLHLQGLVYPEWRPEPPFYIPYKEPPRTWPRIMGIDPHPRKPTAVLWIAISPDTDRWYCYREMFDESLRKVVDIAEAIHLAEAFEDIDERVIDFSAREHELTSDFSIHEQFMDQDIYCELSDKTDKMGGIEQIHNMLSLDNLYQVPQLVVMDTCPTVCQNFMNHIWQDWAIAKTRSEKDPKPDVVKKYDDMLDLIRYLRRQGDVATDFRPEASVTHNPVVAPRVTNSRSRTGY